MRATDDPRVQRIMAAIDRAAAHPTNEPGDTFVPVAAGLIVTRGHDCEHFDIRRRPEWPLEGLRAIVLAYALHAPEDVLEAMAEVADDEPADVESQEVAS